MVNGLLTLRGAWDKVKEDPILKFMVVAITAYGMATLEGPLLSLKNVNAIGHFTDWIVAHVHVGALGWNGLFTFAMLYWLVPQMWKTSLYSKTLANTHFLLATLGIIFYALPMYWAGVTQSIMWKEFTPDGYLKYVNFLDTVTQIMPMYALRALGGTLYMAGVFIMIYNLIATAKSGSFVADEAASAPALEKAEHHQDYHWHNVLERRPIQFTLLMVVAICIGGAVELIPTFLVKSNIPTISSVKPYTPLELQGRDIYIREGCVGCHSQMIRPFRSETERYGEYSKAGEYVYDHPFLWGSKRTGPDLLRVGRKYSHAWHYRHMMDPTAISPGSIMPSYPWLFEQSLDATNTTAKVAAMRTLGVPYEAGYESMAMEDLSEQSEQICADLAKDKIIVSKDKEIIAIIAYLQRLGTDIKVNETE